MYILRPHAAGILYAHPFIHPPTHEGYFKGGGWGFVKSGPVFLPTVGSFLFTIEGFLLMVVLGSFLVDNLSSLAYNLSVLTCSWSFFAHNGQVHLIST